MAIAQRPLVLPDDLPSVLALADRCSPLGLPHVADWPYRFASWAFDEPENAQVWHDGAGQLVGWAALQTPFWAIDALVRPDGPPGLYHTLLRWATLRAQALAAAGAGRPLWFVSIADACSAARRELGEIGFADVSEADEDSWSKVLFALPEARALAAAPLPAGMQIRNLRAPDEVSAYVALHRAVFESESMTAPWRLRTTQMPGYRNELDLVLVAGDNTLCGFCVAWLHQREGGELVGQIEPLGIAEGFRGRRLSQNLLAEAVSRLRRLGASRIFVETDRQREAAMATYTALGFEVAYELRIYRYDVPGAQESEEQL
jgi:ribosomal protein S18 acetylase RimI-like enzyme